MFTDTHCHLDLSKFEPDRVDVIHRARQAGIARILVPGLNLASSRSCINMAETHPMIFAAVGIHPTEAADLSEETLEKLRVLAHNPRVKAIGEIGLDYYWDAFPHDLQQSVFKNQLALAAFLNLPVVIHFREKGDYLDGPCVQDMLAILESWVATLRRNINPIMDHPGVLHSYSGSLDSAQRAIELGFYLGVTGPVTYSRSRQEIIANLPLDSILVETDSPFLAPAPFRGKRNEPAYVRLIADKIALLHNRSIEEVALITSANANQLFHWDD